MAGKRWNGSAWVDHATKKRWNGSTWVDLTIAKRWNGSAWVDIYTGGGGGGGSAILLNPTTSSFEDTLVCDNPSGSCPLTDTQSDTVVYAASGGTGPYTVTAVVSTGPALTLNVNNVGFVITASTTVGRNLSKEGEVKVTVTDSLAASADFYIPFSFSYIYTQENLGPPFEPDYPPAEQF
jgi:hypothetical protein